MLLVWPGVGDNIRLKSLHISYIIIEILRAVDKAERLIVFEPAKKIYNYADTREPFGSSDLNGVSEVQP
jgi:hypothetical protein